MSEEFAWGIIDKCKFATIAMIDHENKPYSVPVSIVRGNEKNSRILYFHCAQEGKKIDVLKSKPDVCINCIGDNDIIPNKFTTSYESAIAFGKAVEVVKDEEKIYALRLLCMRFTPDNMSNFDRAINNSLNKTLVWKIEVESISGKAKIRKD